MNTVNLGQQFSAIATSGDRIPAKNPDGKTYREILPDLEAEFKPQEHSEFYTGKDKQGKETFYCYVKWQFIRRRLDEVAGRDGWILERTGMFIDEAGRPVLVGRMNILGCVKESIGFGKAHEKWKGTLIENAEADLLKNAAEAHGVGRYLDNQPQTIQYLWDNAGGDEYIKSMARKLGVQYSLNLRSQTQENNAVADSHFSEKPRVPLKVVKRKSQGVATAVQNALYPQHNALVRKVRNLTGHDPSFVVSWCKKRGAETPEQLPPESLEILLKDLALDWAEEKFQSAELALTSYQGKISILTAGGVSLADAIASWIESVESPVGGRNG